MLNSQNYNILKDTVQLERFFSGQELSLTWTSRPVLAVLHGAGDSRNGEGEQSAASLGSSLMDYSTVWNRLVKQLAHSDFIAIISRW